MKISKWFLLWFGFASSCYADSIVVVRAIGVDQLVQIFPEKSYIYYEKPQTFRIRSICLSDLVFESMGAKIDTQGDLITVHPLNVGNCHLTATHRRWKKQIFHKEWSIKYIPNGFLSLNGVKNDSFIPRMTAVAHGKLEYEIGKPYVGIVDCFYIKRYLPDQNKWDTLWAFQSELTPDMKKYISTLKEGSMVRFEGISVKIYPAQVRRKISSLNVLLINPKSYLFGG